MSWENGDNLYDYCGNAFIKYAEDTTIISKALSVLQYYDSLNNYPYALNDMNRAIADILGMDIDTINHYIIPGIKEMEKDDSFIYWDRKNVFQIAWHFELDKLDLTTKFPEDIIDGFENEIAIFATAVGRSPSLYWLYSSDPLKLQEIEIYRDHSDQYALIRFNRKDGQSLEFRVTDSDLSYIADTANQFRKDNKDGHTQ